MRELTTTKNSGMNSDENDIIIPVDGIVDNSLIKLNSLFYALFLAHV